jgi:hypothetical protein
MNARMLLTSVAGLLAVTGPAPRAFAAAKTEYLIVSPHTPEQCLAVLDEVVEKDKKLLAKMDWGCMAGDHTGYLKVTAENEQAALALLPEKERATSKAVKLNKFTPDQIREFHSHK